MRSPSSALMTELPGRLGLPGGSHAEQPMVFPGALSNPETSAVLRKLAEVVRAAAARPEPKERPKAERGRRPGWVAPLVLAVLASAAEPMTPLEIVREIEQRFGEHPAHPSVVSALRYGKEAQLGLIERAGGGRYLARRAS
jgi:hypothetical protein